MTRMAPMFPMCRLAASLAVMTALAALAAAAPALADVYVWKDPQTGGRRMSNSPPQWLREGTPGPKVEVIRDNRVIDAATAFSRPQEAAEPSARQRAVGQAAAAASGRPQAKPQPQSQPQTDAERQAAPPSNDD